MSSLIHSRILAADFAWPHNPAWDTLICVLLLTFTYLLWSKWTSSVQHQPRGQIPDVVVPDDSTGRNVGEFTSGTRHTTLGEGGGNTLNTTSRQEKKGKPCCDNDRTPVANSRQRKFVRTDYTVGWICAISTEHVASQAFLDEEHEGPEDIPDNDDNDYTLGRVGKHNVVIVVLPIGEYGTASAASVAKDLSRSFPNVRIGLMVGIGGGAPSQKHDIRLGDIVVSTPGNGDGGVLQYDFGKTIQGGIFHTTGFLNQPPTFLRTAVNGLKTQHKSKGHHLEEAINSILKRNPKLQEFERPHSSTDRLYRPQVRHPQNNESSCRECCGNNRRKLVPRRDRTEHEDNPTIHYGLIASANQVIKDALVRDKLIAQKDVLCFEMEAAGLMNGFPCLVIRGICDYADSHKNKEWQGYAAMSAAAYAKDLLLRIPPKAVEAEEKISDILSGLLLTVEKQLAIQEDTIKREQSAEQRECLQLFRLTESNKDTTYEWYKDHIEDRVEGTCQWLLQHHHFKEWLKQDSGPLLVTADPGCGKSVLAKYLVNYGLPRSSTICYFFFKEQDQNKLRQALCALLHQLFSQKPLLIDHAMPQFLRDGQGLINSTQSLWTVLENAVKDPQAGRVILVLDALDECAELDFESLVRNVKNQLSSDQTSHGNLKYLLTSRPYEKIVCQFRNRNLLKAFPNIRIPGEEESEAISQEVNLVITHRVSQVSEEKCLSHVIKSHLEKRLQETTHRTYLWVYLVFDYLEKENFKKTLKGVESIIATLPRSINEAYERILNKSKEHPMVRKALSIILAASRPLTLSEMNVAVNIDATLKSIHDLDLEDEGDFKSRLRSWCGLFVSIYGGRIYFLHQTAREFLLSDLVSLTTVPSEPRWYHSITSQHAHAVLAEASVIYLNFFNSELGLHKDANGGAAYPIDSYAFLDYSAKTWGTHFRKASIIDDAAIAPVALRICNPDSKSYSAWFRIYWQSTRMEATEQFTDLMVSSYYGHLVLVKLLLENGAEIEAKDSSHGRTPLSWAAEKGHEAVVRLLLGKGANVDSKDRDGRTPLSRTAAKGHEAIVKLLLGKGAEIDSKSEDGRTPLSQAAGKGHEAVVKLLLEKADEVDSRDRFGWTPLSWAAGNGRLAVVKLLLEKHDEADSKDKTFDQTALLLAAENGHEAIVKLLLEKGANVDSKDRNGRTPLSQAAASGREVVVNLLLENGATVDSKDRDGRTPLSEAAASGREAVIKLLLEKGTDVDAMDSKYGRTPLSWASENGHEAVVKLLLEMGADIDTKDENGRTPLSWAAWKGHKAVVRLLEQMPGPH